MVTDLQEKKSKFAMSILRKRVSALVENAFEQFYKLEKAIKVNLFLRFFKTDNDIH